MKNDPKNFSLGVPLAFPSAWVRVMDETIPAFVKEHFSPTESWKTKPFDKEDVNFFAKGLIELSDFFTEDRMDKKLPNYFTTGRFRSSYFLYFFGLQAAKFLTLFDRYPQAIEAALDHAVETGTLRIIDVGSGPGTASLALLVFLLDGMRDPKEPKQILPFSIELVWVDHNETIMKDGEKLLGKILQLFPDLEGDISVKRETRSWWKHPKDFNFQGSLVLFGNVLNESHSDPRIYLEGLAPFLKNPKGGGVLILEPAFKIASQRVSQIRDEVVTSEDWKLPIWGPCFHTSKCPLGEGRDWCHFSVPSALPGKIFKKFSVKLGSVREWLKFSFIWFAEKDSKLAKKQPKDLVRVISDPLRTRDGKMMNQICRPERFEYHPTPKKPLHRGDVIRDPVLQSSHKKNRY